MRVFLFFHFHFITFPLFVFVSVQVVVEWFGCLIGKVIWFERERQKWNKVLLKEGDDKGWNEQVRQTQEQRDDEWRWRERKKWDDCCWKNDWWNEIEEWVFEKRRMKKERDGWWEWWLLCCLDERMRMIIEMSGIEWVVFGTRDVGWLEWSGWFDDEMKEVFYLMWRWMEWCG